jgi:branched-subunit amino acid transport protein AzlD
MRVTQDLVSSRNMFPTIRNLQIRVHVYCPRLSVVLFRWLPIMTLCRKDKQSWINICKQIIPFSRTVMQMICVWPKIWLFWGDYRSCVLFSWWKKCRMQVKIYSVCTTSSEDLNVLFFLSQNMHNHHKLFEIKT